MPSCLSNAILATGQIPPVWDFNPFQQKHSDRPILDLQTRHSPEFVGVVRYQDQVPGHDLPGNQRVIGADGHPLDGQDGADFAGLPGVLLVEIQYLELQAVHQRDIARGALALERAVKQF